MHTDPATERASEILTHFGVTGRFETVEPWGQGHIHGTFRATLRDAAGGAHRYILQRFNHTVFADPPLVMENIRRVTAHLRGRLAAEGVGDVERRVVTVVPLRDGTGGLWRDASGGWWRVLKCIEGAVTYETVEDPALAADAAREFGRFAALLADLPAPPLHETLRAFHHGPRRFAALRKALEADSLKRAAGARPEIQYALDHEESFGIFERLRAAGALPERTCHYDTKVNNVLFDAATGRALCVIDLDTAMPGLVPFDFGDMARTSMSPAAEDETDLSRVVLREPFFEALVRGYLEGTGGMLTPTEVEHLVTAAWFMPTIMGIRFLTDYLEGDHYYRTSRPGHNLDRCRTQFRLAALVEERDKHLRAIVARLMQSR